MKNWIIISIIILLPSLSYAHSDKKECVFKWCDAPLPKIYGEKVVGKDNCGNYCSKHGVEIKKNISKHESNYASVTVKLSTDENGKPIMTASCPKGGMSKYDYKLYKAGFVQKSRKKGDFLHIYYEKER